MSDESDFQELIARVRAGDQNACTELERCYGETMRVMVRTHLRRKKLQPRVGASDVVQSVMAVFFNRAAQGQYSLSEPADVVKLLTTMVKRKVNDHLKQKNAIKRGGGKATRDDNIEPVDPQPSPSTVIGQKELFEKVWNLLSAEEQRLARFRAWEDLSWAEVGVRLGIKSNAARKRYDRLCADAAKRYAKEGRHE